jgi:MoxR-like ATPase
MTPEEFGARYAALRTEIAKVVMGQEDLVDGVLTAALAEGHVLIEGAPGLGKTLLCRAFAQAMGCAFKRVQFTPDLMPSDITGSSVYDKERGIFTFLQGPIFGQLVLADEINRAPAKTQAALLEAMSEARVSVDGKSHALPSPFLVIATQNPVESQGTYPLPEAQLDRFMVKLRVADPPREVEERIVMLHAHGFDPGTLGVVSPVATPDIVIAMQRAARAVTVDPAIVSYMVELVRRTREDRAIELGASPRASIALLKAARVVALSQGRGFVTPDDVKPLAPSVLRHRITLHPDAELQGMRADDRIADILRAVPVPRAQ